jgi:hypothetical protein
VIGAPEGSVSTPEEDRRPTGRPVLLGLLVAAVVAQLVVLYAPSDVGPLPFPHADKVVHVGVFLVPVALALLAGFREAPVVALFAGQAVVSELVQWRLLADRSGDVVDVLADLTGVVLGVVVARLVGSGAAKRSAGRRAR